METDYRALAEWALSGSTGASASAIARHMVGAPHDGYANHPVDGGDFGRCERLLDAVPGFRDRLHEMATVTEYWAALVPRWAEIKAAHEEWLPGYMNAAE